MRTCLCALLPGFLLLAAGSQEYKDPQGVTHDPFGSVARARVFLFARTDCPITNRYAPELRRIAAEFKDRGVDFWLVYSDRSEMSGKIESQIAEYDLPGSVLLDPEQKLARQAEASVTPQAAVFDRMGRLTYSGRIDDRFIDFGKARIQATTHDLEDAVTDTLNSKPVLHARTRAVGCYLADVK